jgi:hypothetical protein
VAAVTALPNPELRHVFRLDGRPSGVSYDVYLVN